MIVSFQGTSNMGDCSPSGTFVFCTGDFDIVDQLVACAVKNRNVDPHRIYSMGCSAGGLIGDRDGGATLELHRRGLARSGAGRRSASVARTITRRRS